MLTFLKDDQSWWVKPVRIICLCLKSKSLPAAKEINYSVEEVACHQECINDHKKRIYSVKSFPKKRHSSINGAHPLQSDTETTSILNVNWRIIYYLHAQDARARIEWLRVTSTTTNQTKLYSFTLSLDTRILPMPLHSISYRVFIQIWVGTIFRSNSNHGQCLSRSFSRINQHPTNRITSPEQ